MAFKMGSHANNIVVPNMTANTFGSELHGGDGATRNSYWAYPGGPASTVASGWRYRSLYTHGYLAAGYKGSNAWRCTNKTWHQTDTTLYCGEQLDREGSYLDGNFSDHNGYLQNNGHTTSGTNLSSYSLANGQTRKITTTGGFASSGVSYGYVGNDPKNQGLDYGSSGYSGDVGGWNFQTSCGDSSGVAAIINQAGYWSGGGTTETAKLHYPTEIMYTTTACPSSGKPATGAHGENNGWCEYANNVRYGLALSNDSWHSSGWGDGCGDCQPKALSTKYGHHYVGTGNNVTSSQQKFSDSNGAKTANPGKVRACGEENPEMGQDWGYMLGHYDGQQNNHTVKYVYSSDAQTTLGATAMPKGHFGQSSGCCAPGAANITNVGVS
jgi:hypothetical protein